MNINWISASNFSAFDWCQFRFYLLYEMKMEELKKPSKATAFGSAVHKILERYAKGDKDWKKCTDEALDEYKPWQYLEDPSIEDIEGIHKDAERLVNIALNRAEKPFDRKVLMAEGKFSENLLKEKPLYGFIDLVTEIDKDTIEIRDWKTGRPEKEEVVKSGWQTKIYDLASVMMWPQYKNRLITVDFLKSQPVSFMYTDEERLIHSGQIKDNLDKVQACSKPTRVLDVNRKMMWKCKAPPKGWCLGIEKCDKLYSLLFNV